MFFFCLRGPKSSLFRRSFYPGFKEKSVGPPVRKETPPPPADRYPVESPFSPSGYLTGKKQQKK
jgi:hypothetical protein